MKKLVKILSTNEIVFNILLRHEIRNARAFPAFLQDSKSANFSYLFKRFETRELFPPFYKIPNARAFPAFYKQWNTLQTRTRVEFVCICYNLNDKQI